jgi:hypothetical protein
LARQNRIILWEVDTPVDFMLLHVGLYVPGESNPGTLSEGASLISTQEALAKLHSVSVHA